MKKTLILKISLVIIQILFLNNISLAGNLKDGSQCFKDSECTQGMICHPEGAIDKKGNQQKYCRDLIQTLTQRPNSTNTDAKQLTKLPDVSLEGGMTLAIKAILRSAMYLTIIAIVVAAMYYIISRGKDEDMTKAKDIILYLVIGMAIIAAAYGIVAGVTQFNVFS